MAAAGAGVSELPWLTAGEIARRFAEHSLSPVELLHALLDRIAQEEPRLNVFVTLDRAGAEAAARQAEHEIRTGRRRGPLHGIPVAIKDIIDVAGLPTTCHSQILRENIATADAAVVARLRAAGAVILGKVATHEFAIGGPSFDLPFPPARNPWNPRHHPGGSSSGCGAGLAAGFFPLAVGSDTAGSIRHPAAACGVVGLKPSHDRVSRQGVFPLAYTLDHVGPMSRSVADAALLLDVLADPDPQGAVRTDRFGAGLSRDPRGLRLGFVRHFHETDMPAAAEVGAALEAAAETLAGLGMALHTAHLPDLRLCAAVNRTVLHAEAWSVHAPWLRARPGEYGQLARRRLLTGAFLTAGDYIDAQRLRRRITAAIDSVFDTVDVLLTANAMDPPCRIDDAAAIAQTYPRQARTPFNLSGHPAIALMAGLSQAGLPLSLQLVGRQGDEATLLGVASAYERATPWHRLRPAAAV